MTTIIPVAPQAAVVLGKQKRREGVTYRLIKYVMQEPVENGVLLYNAMTMELLLLTPEEADTMMESEELLERWFLVPQEHNDRKLVDDLRAFAQAMYKPQKHITYYKVLTTNYCNARCYYCYEQNFRNTKTMSPATARQLVKYIAENCGGNRVELEWYGGEPLLNQEAIDIVSKGLTDAGIPFFASIVTNGYLFDEANIGKARDLWRVDLAQITLDGTEEIYNRTKDYINPQGSPFLRVMKNVEALLNAGIHINITMNVSEENWQDLQLLAERLAEQFGGRKDFRVLCAPVNDVTADGTMTISDGNFKKYYLVKERLTQLGLHYPGRVAHSIRINACKADNDSSIVVFPDGALGYCEGTVEEERFGSIFSSERDEAMINSWKERIPPTDPMCDDCLHYPQCVRLKKCPGGVCSARMREFQENVVRSRILYVYRHYQQQEGR